MKSGLLFLQTSLKKYYLGFNVEKKIDKQIDIQIDKKKVKLRNCFTDRNQIPNREAYVEKRDRQKMDKKTIKEIFEYKQLDRQLSILYADLV